ncbi:MAG TPA: restriction endonuclease subunit R, partial [Vicinamibacteria bacterium]|nr:restriction endonuclease subunit R [Vicinamibacteria bacterium]
MTRLDRNSLERDLATEEARLRELEAQYRQAWLRVDELRRQIGACREPSPNLLPVVGPRTSADKIALFRTLFRGRTDVYPTRWRNLRKGTSGYAPACANEWIPEVCEKPRVKCGECANQAFLAITDRVILDHLQGRIVAGVYPLLEDDTCWFLAMDFDKGTWEKDVSALVETCRGMQLPTAVERSRSGNGAHVWFFFREPVSARTARQFGCHLITQTMARRHELPMASYDRLFPNQDMLPRGGFGNLIALPFQNEARLKGNTVFVNENWVPHEDQWAFLARLRRLDASEVELIVREARRKGAILGVQLGDSDDEDSDSMPWLRTPSRRRPRAAIAGPLPETARATLAQAIFLEKAGLPSPLLNEIKRLAAFQNPEFYKKQALRFSTALTPRIVSCAEELPLHVALPRGCYRELKKLLTDYQINLITDDLRVEGSLLCVDFHGELGAVQKRAAKALEAT